jgi:ribosomal protein L37AE/L43A
MKTFEEFEALSLFCPKCKTLREVKKRLLLVLIDGEIWEYLCKKCGSSLGSKKITKSEKISKSEEENGST